MLRDQYNRDDSEVGLGLVLAFIGLLVCLLGLVVIEDRPEPAVEPGDALLGPEEALAPELVRDAVL